MISFDEFLKQDECDKYNMLQECGAYIKSKDKEIERLNNIINELEKHFVFLKMNSTGGNKEFMEDILLFIKELKDSDKE